EGGPGPEWHVEAPGAVVAVEGEVGDAGDERCRESRGGQEEALARRHRPVTAVVEEAGLREQHPASTVARRRGCDEEGARLGYADVEVPAADVPTERPEDRPAQDGREQRPADAVAVLRWPRAEDVGRQEDAELRPT